MLPNLWKWYQNCFTFHPLKTQMISSGVLWGLGDISAQYITHSGTRKRLPLTDKDKDFKVNWKRIALTCSFGTALGPVGYFWYLNLDKFIKVKLHLQPNTARFVAAKVAIDGLIFGPLDLCLFFTYLGVAAGKNAHQVKEDLKKNFLPALALEGGVWPIVQIVNFRYVPVRFQLLYIDVFCLLDSAFLSWLDQQEEVPWNKWFKSFNSFKDRGGQGRL